MKAPFCNAAVTWAHKAALSNESFCRKKTLLTVRRDEGGEGGGWREWEVLAFESFKENDEN
jgi:hypothetical protein